MGLIADLPSFVAGERLGAGPDAPKVASLDGKAELPVAGVSATLLRKALRYAETSQQQLARTPLAERIAAAGLLMQEYARRREAVAWGLGLFRGLVARDSYWMCDLMATWADQLGVLTGMMFGGDGGGLSREVKAGGGPSRVLYESKGKAALFCAATMDGPSAVTAIAHGIVAGTHLIVRPSWRDPATHLAFEILAEHGLGHYAQLVRWTSDGADADQLNRLVLGNVAQSLIFSSNETFSRLVAGGLEAGSPAWEAAFRRSKRYGTGLPLAVVTPEADPAEAAAQLVEGARLGNGRFCLSTSPVLVLESAMAPLLKEVKARAAALRRGSVLDPSVDLGLVDPAEVEPMRRMAAEFGGRIEFGQIRADGMDVLVLGGVPDTSPCLSHEFPGTILCLVPVRSLEHAAELARTALAANHREAWTAITTYGSTGDYEQLTAAVPAYRHLHGGITSQVKLLLPHQGSYFALDMMRRVTREQRLAA